MRFQYKERPFGCFVTVSYGERDDDTEMGFTDDEDERFSEEDYFM